MKRRRAGSRSSPDGDVDALVTRVYERHAGAIASYALRRSTAADAADIVAETFLVAWRRHDEIPEEPNTLPWLYGVARRVLANQRRSRDRRTALHDRLMSDFVAFDAQRDRVEDTEDAQRVARAMTSLSSEDSELLRLVAWEGLSTTELATALDIEPSAARQRLRRARQRLRKSLASQNPRADCPGEQTVLRSITPTHTALSNTTLTNNKPGSTSGGSTKPVPTPDSPTRSAAAARHTTSPGHQWSTGGGS